VGAGREDGTPAPVGESERFRSESPVCRRVKVALCGTDSQFRRQKMTPARRRGPDVSAFILKAVTGPVRLSACNWRATTSGQPRSLAGRAVRCSCRWRPESASLTRPSKLATRVRFPSPAQSIYQRKRRPLPIPERQFGGARPAYIWHGSGTNAERRPSPESAGCSGTRTVRRSTGRPAQGEPRRSSAITRIVPVQALPSVPELRNRGAGHRRPRGCWTGPSPRH